MLNVVVEQTTKCRDCNVQAAATKVIKLSPAAASDRAELQLFSDLDDVNCYSCNNIFRSNFFFWKNMVHFPSEEKKGDNVCCCPGSKIEKAYFSGGICLSFSNEFAMFVDRAE